MVEKKKFTSYIQQQRRGRGIRSDSMTSQGVDGLVGDSILHSPPSTPAPHPLPVVAPNTLAPPPDENPENCHRSGSMSSSWSEEPVVRRRRSSSASKFRSRSSSIEDPTRIECNYFDYMPVVSPWEERTFPLCDMEYENLFKEPSMVSTQPVEEPPSPEVAVAAEKVTTFMTGYTEDAIPPSPFSDTSTISNIMEGDLDDPNDPEWTVVGTEKPNPKPANSHGIVLKLAKRA